MKALAVVALGVILSTAAWAQRGGMRSSGGGVRIGGGIHGGGFRGGFQGGNLHFRSGFRPGDFRYYRTGFFPSFSYYPGFGLDNYNYSYNPCPSYVWNYDCGYPIYNPPALAAPAAPVVVNQFTPAQPEVRVYEPPSPQPSAAEPAGGGPVIYLIAFDNNVIRPALAYWVEGVTLRYLDLDHKQQQAALATVDREFSARLNRERRVPFSLP